jgi:hypothetical protein
LELVHGDAGELGGFASNVEKGGPLEVAAEVRKRVLALRARRSEGAEPLVVASVHVALELYAMVVDGCPGDSARVGAGSCCVRGDGGKNCRPGGV